MGPRDATSAKVVSRGRARGPRHKCSGHGRKQTCVVYYAHYDGGYHEDHHEYYEGYFYEDGYYRAEYRELICSHKAQTGYARRVCFCFVCSDVAALLWPAS